MRHGNNECPACSTHCASRCSLRNDPNYEALIAALYPDIDDKYEVEIQASIAQTFREQAEALGKKHASARATTLAFVRRQGSYRNLRTWRNHRTTENQGSDVEKSNGHDGSKESSSADERSTEVKSNDTKDGEVQEPMPMEAVMIMIQKQAQKYLVHLLDFLAVQKFMPGVEVACAVIHDMMFPMLVVARFPETAGSQS